MEEQTFAVIDIPAHDASLIDLTCRFLRTHRPANDFPFASSGASQLQPDMLANRLAVIIAKTERLVVGHVSLSLRNEFCGKTGYASMLLVHPDWRGRGISRMLLGRLVNRAAFMGAESIETHCAPTHPEAQRLIEDLGFVLEAPSDRHYRLVVTPRS